MRNFMRPRSLPDRGQIGGPNLTESIALTGPLRNGERRRRHEGESMPVATPDLGPAKAAATPQADHTAWPSARTAYFTVFMLGVAVMFAEIDRTAMQYLVKPIKDVFHL